MQLKKDLWNYVKKLIGDTRLKYKPEPNILRCKGCRMCYMYFGSPICTLASRTEDICDKFRVTKKTRWNP